MKTLRIKYPAELSEVNKLQNTFNFLHFPNTTIINIIVLYM